MAMTKTKKPAKKTTKPKERAEKAERERDEWKARHDTLADVSRKCIATAERERDEARANYAFMVERAANQKLDGYRELGARAAAAEERAEKAELERDAYRIANVAVVRERDDARAERDARPDISPEDCDATVLVCALTDNAVLWPDGKRAADRIVNALRAHAAKVKP